MLDNMSKTLAFVLLAQFIALSNNCYAEEMPSQEVEMHQVDGATDVFNYEMEGRNDPFKPFIAPQVAGPDPNEIVEDDVELTGMQLFEPGQLTLVGVMNSEQDHLAMVQDQTGKGYVIREGMLIGRRGIISQIDFDQVLVTETAKTRSGREIKTTVTMKMKNEGDK